MCKPSAAQWPKRIVWSLLRRSGMRNQGRYPGGASFGEPENPDKAPSCVQVRSLVRARVVAARRSKPVSEGLHCRMCP